MRSGQLRGEVYGYLRFTPGNGVATLLIRCDTIGAYGFREVECIGKREDVAAAVKKFDRKLVDIMFHKHSFTVHLADEPLDRLVVHLPTVKMKDSTCQNEKSD